MTLVLVIAVVVAIPVNADDLFHSLQGTWRLVSAKSIAADGTTADLYGTPPLGQLVYDSTGHMSVHLLKPNLPKCGSIDRRKCPDSQARQAFDNYLGYWGTYTVEGQVVVNQIEGASVPDWVGTSQKRTIQISGKRLKLTTPPQPIGGVQSTIVLELERE
jgi:hypothetical protein